MENIDSLRNRIQKIRECLDKLNGDGFSIEYKPVVDFKDKLNYPIDFQIFMEQIGEFNSACFDALIFEIRIPQPLLEHDISVSPWREVKKDDKIRLDYPINGISDEKDIRIFGADVDSQCFGFDTSTSSYKFIFWDSYMDWSEEYEWVKKYLNNPHKFLEWFVFQVNNELNDNPYVKKKVRLK